MPPGPAVDVVDTTWIAVAPHVLADPVADPANWRRWWPELELEATELRGPKGVRWRVRRDDGGLHGSMEIYLQPVVHGTPVQEGTLGHFFLRLDGDPDAVLSRRSAQRYVALYRSVAKRLFWELSDEYDHGRLARVSVAGATRGRPERAPDRPGRVGSLLAWRPTSRLSRSTSPRPRPP